MYNLYSIKKEENVKQGFRQHNLLFFTQYPDFSIVNRADINCVKKNSFKNIHAMLTEDALRLLQPRMSSLFWDH